MKVSRLIAIITALCLTILVLPAAFTGTFLPAAAQQEFAASLSPVAGLVQFQAKGSARWVTLRENQLVRPGDQVRTGNDGFARLTTVTGFELELYPTTYIEL